MATMFFLALCLVAMVSQPGAAHDEWFHAPSIWCGQGTRPPGCYEKFQPTGTYYEAWVNLEQRICGREPTEVLHCPSNFSEPIRRLAQINTDLYPPVFYFVLSWFVVSSPEVSYLTTRFGSILIITLLLTFMIRFLPSRHLNALLLLLLTCFSTTGFYLLSSLNPSSWVTFGVGLGWLSLHAAISRDSNNATQKLVLATVGVIALSMACGSRWDAVSFVALAIVLISADFFIVRFPRSGRKAVVAILTLGVMTWLALELLSPLSPLAYTANLFEYSEGQRDNIAFISDNLLQGFPNALAALGSVPTQSPVYLPGITYVLNIALLSYLMIRTFNRNLKIQIVGFGVVLVSIAGVIAAQVASLDSRDHGPLEPRYVYPLLLLGVGWWYLKCPPSFLGNTEKVLKKSAIIATANFGITTFTIAERYVDRQTFSFRFLPEGPENWWWSWLPIGPNMVVFLAPVFLWLFLHKLIDWTTTSYEDVVVR